MAQAKAGMTVITLTDIARIRLDSLSFFIFAYLVICWLVKLLWNHLAKTFTSMPRLDYRRVDGKLTATTIKKAEKLLKAAV